MNGHRTTLKLICKYSELNWNARPEGIGNEKCVISSWVMEPKNSDVKSGRKLYRMNFQTSLANRRSGVTRL